MNAWGKPVMESKEFTVKVTGPSFPEGKEFKVMSGDKLMISNLKHGEYTIVELNAEGYMVTMMPMTGKVMVGEMPAALKIWNKEKMVMEDKGMLTIHKYLKDSEGNIITTPMKFEIHVTGPSFPEGKHFEIMNGTPLVLKDLKYGKYTVEETAVEGYKTTMWPENGEVWVKMYHPATLKIWNMEEEMEEEVGTLIIKKYLKDSEGEIINEQEEFTIHITGPSFPGGMDFTIKNGVEWKKEDLKFGEYTIVEKDTEGYKVTMDPATGKVTVGMTPVTLKIWNMEEEVEEVMGELVIHKVLLDNMGKPVTDVREFKIWVKGPSYTEWKEFTVKNGTPLVIKDLKLGLYEVKEVGAEDYEVKIGEMAPLTAQHRSHTVTVTNMEEALGQLTIHKILKDEDGKVITAAKNFKIWVKGPSFPNGKEFTVKNGTPLVIKDLVYGTYTVTEPGASKDYKVSIKQSPKLTIMAKMGTVTITNMEIEVEEVSPLPQTGGVSSSVLYLMSSIMILGGLGLLRKKED
jgi:LPXTG-motif cell wall-anchored protein